MRVKRVKGSSSSKNPDACFAGVIFNRVASESHYLRLKDSVRDVAVMGYLPRDLNFEISHRHLGLTVAEENPITDESIQRLAKAVLGHIDVDAIASNPFKVKVGQSVKTRGSDTRSTLSL